MVLHGSIYEKMRIHVILTFLSLALVNCVGLSNSNFKTAKVLKEGESQILTGVHTMGSHRSIDFMYRKPVIPDHFDAGIKLNYNYFILGLELDAKYRFLHLGNFSSALDLSVLNLPALFIPKKYKLYNLIMIDPAWLMTYQVTDWLSFTSGFKARFYVAAEYRNEYGLPLAFDVGNYGMGAMVEGACFFSKSFKSGPCDFGAAVRYNFESDDD